MTWRLAGGATSKMLLSLSATRLRFCGSLKEILDAMVGGAARRCVGVWAADGRCEREK